VLLSHAAMREDLTRLARLLIDSHPDPYRGDGPIGFFRQAAAIADALPDTLSAEEFLAQVRPLVAGLQDGHTTIRLPAATDDEPRLRLWIDLGIVEESLYIRGVYDEALRDLLGARLVGIGGVSLETILARTARTVGCDNAMDVRRRLVQALSDRALLRLLVPEASGDRVGFNFDHPARGAATVTVPWTKAAAGPRLVPLSRIAYPARGPADLGWTFLDGERQVACLRIGPLMRYREAGEVWRHSGFRRPLLEWYREETGREEAQEASDEALAQFLCDRPAATDLLLDLVQAMAAACTEWLIVDCSEATGGNSALAYLLGYALAGKEALLRAGEGYQIPRYSALYAENYGAIPEPALLDLGGYDFRGERRWRQQAQRGWTATAEAAAHREWADFMASVPSFAAATHHGSWPEWRPQLVVVTAAETYSAGFDVALTLRRLGAWHVGVASAQAPNCFIDVLRYRLPHSGLEGTISFKESLALPDVELPDRMLRPQVSLTYEILQAYGFDPHAGVRLALDRVVNRSADSTIGR
jgi:hypothetical protein